MKKISRKTKLSVLLAAVLVTVSVTVSVLVAKYLSDDVYQINAAYSNDAPYTIDLIDETTDFAPVSYGLTSDEPELDFLKVMDIYGGAAAELPFSVDGFIGVDRKLTENATYTMTVTFRQGDTVENFGAGFADVTESQTLTDTNGVITLTDKVLTPTDLTDPYTITLPADYPDGASVEVLVEFTKPYTKTLKLVFDLHNEQKDVLYYVNDKGVYVDLIIMTSEPLAQGKLKVDWSGINTTSHELQVDCTNNYVLDENLTLTTNDPSGSYLNGITVTQPLNDDESISIYFFKGTDQDQSYTSPREGAAFNSTAPDGTREPVYLNAQKDGAGVYTVTLYKAGEYPDTLKS